MLKKCESCSLRAVKMLTNDMKDGFYYCIAKQYPCEIITECQYIVTIEGDMAEWISMKDGTYNAYCSNCGHERGSKAWNYRDYNYCPQCGKRMRMDGEQK